MIILITVLGIVCWLLLSPSKDSDNTLVVEKATGRVVALVYVNWSGSQSSRIDSMIRVEQTYDPEDFELVEFSDATIGQYDLHLYNRD